MNIQTRYHSEVTIEEKNIWHFEAGLPGFNEEKQFVCLPLEADSVFYVLQSTQTESLGFIITNPFVYFSDYDFKLEDSVIEQLQLEQEQDVQVFTILTVKDPFQKTTANLQAPIILNTKNNQAKQVILNQTDYETRHFLFPPAEKAKG